MSKEMKMLYTNYYKCPQCGYKWEDDWDCQPDDDCPNCGERHITPYKSKDILYDEEGERIWE